MHTFIEDNHRYRWILAVCSLLATMFQVIGFSTTGWVRIAELQGRELHTYLSGHKLEFSVGLWKATACEIDLAKESENCFVMSTVEINEEYITDFVLREIHLAAALATISFVAAVLGLVCLGLMYLNTTFLKIRTRRLIACMCWIISAVFLFAAIICPSQFNYFLKVACTHSGKCEVFFPWSIFTSGIGLLLTIGPAAMIGLLMCFQPTMRRTTIPNI